ncbi:MAG: hypothetical protein EXR72_25955 [Myxococcales bacterium]|nr:hypothetical protein [Myxococcales bacterium]
MTTWLGVGLLVLAASPARAENQLTHFLRVGGAAGYGPKMADYGNFCGIGGWTEAHDVWFRAEGGKPESAAPPDRFLLRVPARLAGGIFTPASGTAKPGSAYSFPDLLNGASAVDGWDACCFRHDACYAKFGCDPKTPASEDCKACDRNAVSCWNADRKADPGRYTRGGLVNYYPCYDCNTHTTYTVTGKAYAPPEKSFAAKAYVPVPGKAGAPTGNYLVSARISDARETRTGLWRNSCNVTCAAGQFTMRKGEHCDLPKSACASGLQCVKGLTGHTCK